MRTTHPRSAYQAHRRTTTEPTDARYLDLPTQTLSLWRRLGLLGLAMMIGFTGWYLHISGGRGGRPIATELSAQEKALVTPPATQNQADESMKSNAADSNLQPRGWTSEADGVVPAVQRSGAESTGPTRIEGGDAPVEVVSRFYRALSAADGKSAAALIVSAKRGIGPFNESSMSKFYGSFKEPLFVRSIRQIDSDTVEVRYRYRASRTACEGVARVKTERVLQQTLIQSVQANC
ncbi:hypothetical protein J7E62_04125 [Variovorax paradoxus]|nr:hypothetical protein [Variovorax paradoxus]